MPAILAEIGRIMVQSQPRQRAYKITRAKRTGGVAQAVECLICTPVRIAVVKKTTNK
jgi:hypothetical protein